MQERSAAIIVAAGSSRRMEGRDKLWIPLAGRITLARTVDVFEASPIIKTIVLVINTERITEAASLCQQEEWHKIASIIAGGNRRQDSVRLGLDTLSIIAPATDWVMIHDGARPLVTPEILEAGLKAVQEYRAVVAALPVKDTIRQVQRAWIHSTLDRSQLCATQTPHAFSFPLIHPAHHPPPAPNAITHHAPFLQQPLNP